MFKPALFALLVSETKIGTQNCSCVSFSTLSIESEAVSPMDIYSAKCFSSKQIAGQAFLLSKGWHVYFTFPVYAPVSELSFENGFGVFFCVGVQTHFSLSQSVWFILRVDFPLVQGICWVEHCCVSTSTIFTCVSFLSFFRQRRSFVLDGIRRILHLSLAH